LLEVFFSKLFTHPFTYYHLPITIYHFFARALGSKNSAWLRASRNEKKKINI